MSWLTSLFGFDWRSRGHKVDVGLVRNLTQVAERLEQWDTASCPEPAHITAAQAEALAALDLEWPEQLRAGLYSAVGEICHVVGYIAFDSGDLQGARSAYADTLDVAGEARGSLGLSLTHRARMSIARAHLTRYRINTLQPHKALEWATGTDDGRLTHTERALAWQVKARAHAVLGDYQAVTRAVRMADHHWSRSSPESDPPWVSASGEPEFMGDTGHAFADVALVNPDVAGQVIREADQRLLVAATHDDAHRRTRLFSRLAAAVLSMRYVDPSRAVEIASPAVHLAPLTPSAQAGVLGGQLQRASERHWQVDEVGWLRRELPALVGHHPQSDHRQR